MWLISAGRYRLTFWGFSFLTLSVRATGALAVVFDESLSVCAATVPANAESSRAVRPYFVMRFIGVPPVGFTSGAFLWWGRVHRTGSKLPVAIGGFRPETAGAAWWD